MSIGVVVGKFLPLHLGHINFINRCYTKVSKLIIVLCHSHRDGDLCIKNGIKIIPYKQRLRWLHQTYSEFDNIEIRHMDESHIPAYPDGWHGYIRLLKETVPEKIDFIFSSENDYDTQYSRLLPEASHVIIDNDRISVPISGTAIRKNLIDNWGFLPSIVRPFFVTKVAIVGTESSAKSTLTRLLGKHYNTSWVEEYGKQYIYDVLGGREDSLCFDDYLKIAMKHKLLEDEAIKTSNKIVFVDTEAIVTNFYCKLYEEHTDPAIDEIIKRQNYDLWLYLDNDVTWFDDGLRSQGHRTQRDKGKELLLSMFKMYGVYDKLQFISGNYEERLDKAISIIDNHMKNINAEPVADISHK